MRLLGSYPGPGNTGFDLTHEAVCPAHRRRMARSATVSARGGREAGHSWERAVDLRSMQLVALKGQLVDKGTVMVEGCAGPGRCWHHPSPLTTAPTTRSCCWRPPKAPLPTELLPGARGRGDEPSPNMGPKPAWPGGLQSSAEGCRLLSVWRRRMSLGTQPCRASPHPWEPHTPAI